MSNISLPLSDLYMPIKTGLDRVVQIIDEEISSELPFINELCQVACGCRGKMLRPALLLLTAESFGPTTEKHYKLAAVVELVHMASLVHDDVLDQAEMRRDLPTINSINGNQAAVMVGDYLVSHAYRLGSSMELNYASQLISSTTNRVCEGELMQIHHRGDFDLTEDIYLDIIRCKTAVLTGACCDLGAKYSGADDEIVETMNLFGVNVGMAFQIADDILDLVGSEKKMGKTLGRDIELGELTLPLIYHFNNAAPSAATELMGVLKSKEKGKRARIVDLLRESGSIDYAVSAAEAYVGKAMENLAALPDSPGKQSLETMADFIIQRDI